MMRRLTFILFLLTMWSLAEAQQTSADNRKGCKGYQITLTVEGSNDSVMYIGNYYLGNTVAIDTATRDRKGNFVFSSKDRWLMPGLYFFCNPKGDYAEFVVYGEELKKVAFHTKTANWSTNMEVKGSQQNVDFYAYQRQNAALFAAGNKPSHQTVDSLKEDFIKSHPDNMLARMMNATRPVSVPQLDDKGDTIPQGDRFRYYVRHYWDNMPLDEDFLVRTPKAIFVNPVKEYLEKALRGGMPADIMPLVDSTIDRARGSQEVFKYLVHTITEYYLQSNVMVYDEIYVHMIDRYYASGEAVWASPSTITSETNRADKWRNLLVGKVAPELILFDTNHVAHSLHHMPNQYKLLVFWSPSCGHCKTTIPEVNNKLKELRKDYDVEVFAIFTEPDENTTPKWKKFIHDHNLHDGWIHLSGAEANCDWREVYDIQSTPQIYLLDRNNKIIAKKLNAEIFETAMRQQTPNKH